MSHVFQMKSKTGMVAHTCNASTESEDLLQVRSQPAYTRRQFQKKQ